MKTSILSKSNLGLFFVGILIASFFCFKTTESNAAPKPICRPITPNICKITPSDASPTEKYPQIEKGVYYSPM